MEPQNGFTNPLPCFFLSVHRDFFWLLLALAIGLAAWLLVGIVRAVRSNELRRDVDELRARRKRKKWWQLLILLVLLELLLLAGAAAAQEQPRKFTVPFREVNHRILIEVEVDGGAPATFLVDTGARVSVLFDPTGHDCGLRLAHHTHGKFALACDGSSPSVGFTVPESEVRFNGLLGADLISKFSSVRIDYKNRVLEFEH